MLLVTTNRSIPVISQWLMDYSVDVRDTCVQFAGELRLTNAYIRDFCRFIAHVSCRAGSVRSCRRQLSPTSPPSPAPQRLGSSVRTTGDGEVMLRKLTTVFGLADRSRWLEITTASSLSFGDDHERR